MKTIILFIIIIAFVLFTSTSKKVMEGLSYTSVNDSIIQQALDSSLLESDKNKSIVCCDNYTYAPNVKCVKQLDQNTCAIPNSDGSCSGNNYTNEELDALKTGNKLDACKIPLTQGNYLTTSKTVTTVTNLQPKKVTKTKKKDISIGDQVTFKLDGISYEGYVTQIGNDLYVVQYTDNGVLTTTSVKKDELTQWEAGKVYMDNLLYSETYSPNNYAFFSSDSKKCCFDAPQKILNTTNNTQSIPEEYQCPIGWDLVTNICTDTCTPCTSRTKDTPESVTYPSKIKKSKTIDNGFVYTNIVDSDDNYGLNTLTAAPFYL